MLKLSTIVLLLAGLVPIPAQSQTVTVVDVSGLPAGKYVLTFDGTTAVLQPLVILNSTPGPNPPPNPPPSPVLTERAKAIRDAALRVTGDPKRAETAQLLGEVYRQIVPLIGNQAKGYDRIMLAISTATDVALRDEATKSAWAPVRAIVTGEANNLARAGAVDAEYAKYFLECSTGFDASAPGKAISPELKKFILEVVLPFVLKFLLSLGQIQK